MKPASELLTMISFEVKTGLNPVPYKRTTQKQKFVDAEYKKYQAYKNLIVKVQKEWIERLRVLGFDAYVCRGAKVAIEVVQKYLPKDKKKLNVKQGTLDV